MFGFLLAQLEFTKILICYALLQDNYKISILNRTKLKIFFIGFALLTAFIRYVLQYQSDIVERFYSKGIFVVVRTIFDNTLYYSKIPMIFVFLFFGVLYLLHIVVRPFREKTALKKRLARFLFSLIAFLSILYSSFMWSWGFNYLRIPIETTLQFSPMPIPVADLKTKLIERLPDLIAAREAMIGSTDLPIDTSFIPENFENIIRDAVRHTLASYEYPANSKVQGRFLPSGSLLRIKTAGIYFPFIGESNIDAGLHPLQYSETLAHEFAHGYGFGDEGTCSFVAYLSLVDAEDSFVRYSLLLSYWRTLARNYLKHHNNDYQNFRKTLPTGIISDLNDIAANRQKYPSIFPNSRNRIYDSYLKAQGIKEGLQNYNRVIMLVEGFEGKD